MTQENILKIKDKMSTNPNIIIFLALSLIFNEVEALNVLGHYRPYP